MNPSKSSTELREGYFLPNNALQPNPQYTRQPSPNQEIDSDDDWGDGGASLRHDYSDERKFMGWRYLLYNGGLGRFLFSTSLGWQLFISVLVLWLWGCGIGLIIMNRIILWSAYLKGNYTSYTRLVYTVAGVYKFPYPLTTTLIELVMAHSWILLSAYITRWASPWLISAGLSGMIAPSRPLRVAAHDFRPKETENGFAGNVLKRTSSGGGIAGGGFFEFDIPIAKQVFPLVAIFVAKVLLSNLSSAYAQFPMYVLARIGIVPLSLIFTSLFGGTKHHWSIVSSTLIATLMLGVSVYHPNTCISWASIFAGAVSSIFVALYPVQVSRTYKSLLISLVPQGDIMSTKSSSDSDNADFSGSKEEARAYWRLLHYTSLLSILIFTPIVILSGELPNFWRDCYTLDGLFYWWTVAWGGLGTWAVFFSTIALIRATSPLTTAFVFVPESSVMLAIMIGKRLPARSWIALALCWASCVWFLLQRYKEGGSRGWFR